METTPDHDIMEIYKHFDKLKCEDDGIKKIDKAFKGIVTMKIKDPLEDECF